MRTCLHLNVKCSGLLSAEKLTILRQNQKSLLDTPGKVNNLQSFWMNSRGSVQEENLMSARSVGKPSVSTRAL